jgi:hypothetical protein
VGGAQQCAPLASLTMIDRHYGHLARDGRDTRSSFSTRSTRARWLTMVQAAKRRLAHPCR